MDGGGTTNLLKNQMEEIVSLRHVESNYRF